MKVAINECYGGFNISLECAELIPGFEINDFSRKYKCCSVDLPRHDPALIAAIETLGSEKASGSYSAILIEDIKGNRYRIREYDGMEWVETPDTIDWIVVE